MLVYGIVADMESSDAGGTEADHIDGKEPQRFLWLHILGSGNSNNQSHLVGAVFAVFFGPNLERSILKDPQDDSKSIELGLDILPN